MLNTNFQLVNFTLILNTCPPLFLLPSFPPIEKYNFLGISIVGQSNERGDGGIYIGSIMKGGAVAADGRIEPGDMLLQVCVCSVLFQAYNLFIYTGHIQSYLYMLSGLVIRYTYHVPALNGHFIS